MKGLLIADIDEGLLVVAEAVDVAEVIEEEAGTEEIDADGIVAEFWIEEDCEFVFALFLSWNCCHSARGRLNLLTTE